MKLELNEAFPAELCGNKRKYEADILSLTGARSVRPVDRKPSFTAPTAVLDDKEEIGMIAK